MSEIGDTATGIVPLWDIRPSPMRECVWVQGVEVPPLEATCQDVEIGAGLAMEAEALIQATDVAGGYVASGFFDLSFVNDSIYTNFSRTYIEDGVIFNDCYLSIYNFSDIRRIYNNNCMSPLFSISTIDNETYIASGAWEDINGDGFDENTIYIYTESDADWHVVDGASTGFDNSGYGWIDLDGAKLYSQYGVCDVEAGSCVRTGTPVASHEYGIFAQDLDLDGVPEFLNGNRLWRMDDLSYRELGYAGNTRFAAPLDIGGVGYAIYGIDRRVILVSANGATEVLYDGIDTGLEETPVSVGDVTGDGAADIVVWDGTGFLVIGSDGALLDRRRASGPICVGVLADLDGDGVYEIISLDSGDPSTGVGGGLTIYDAQHQRIALRDDSVRASSSLLQTPIAADVDGDGSMEIVVAGLDAGGNAVLRTYGPAAGRWARGRPVWNQYGYDITSVLDDGSLHPYPVPGWEAYHAWRAQPAHDGKRPDLQPRLLAACVPDCTAGAAQLAVSVHNTGAAEADAVTVRLLTQQGGRWGVAAEAAAGRIGAMDSAVVTLTVESARWGERQILEVVGDEEECDRINDRVEISFDLCDPPDAAP